MEISSLPASAPAARTSISLILGSQSDEEERNKLFNRLLFVAVPINVGICAVYNLIDNAIRHTGENKRITVAVRKGDIVGLEVRDCGSGIDPAELEHIWEKYYTNRQRGNKGVSGLGLAIVKQIAELHDAEVSAESRPGEGSIFRFSIDKNGFPGLQKKQL